MSELISRMNRADFLTAQFRQGQLVALELMEYLADLGFYEIAIEPFTFGRPVEASRDGVRWKF